MIFVVFWDDLTSKVPIDIIHRLTEAEWRTYVTINYANIGSDNGLSPVRRQPIIWTNDGLLSIRP